MEERLFLIGFAMGAYAWLTRRWNENGRLDKPWFAVVWHAVFFAIAGFALTMIAMLSMESRRFSAPEGLFSPRQLWPSLCGAAVLGLWALWRMRGEAGRAEKRRYFLNEDLEWSETVFSAVLLAALLMYFIVQAFKIPSGSMERTLLVGDHLFVNKIVYGLRIPFTDKRILAFRSVQRGDIVVFRFPTDDKKEEHCGSVQYGKDFIKRAIGLPGDQVELRDGEVFINGKSLGREPYAQYLDPFRHPKPPFPISPEQYQTLWEARNLDHKLGDSMRDNFGPVVVPPDAYLMMGDNRDRSCDGRYWGPVQKKYVKGKAWVLYWPPSRMGGAH
jgi:signal peptidase I